MPGCKISVAARNNWTNGFAARKILEVWQVSPIIISSAMNENRVRIYFSAPE
jgi:hypothetical protein